MKDLDRHFKRMLQRFYLLNGANDVSLKNTYVASLSAQLQPELNIMAMATQKDFSTMTMGQIHQMTKEVVDKLCRQHQYFFDLMNNKGKFGKACKKSYLEIKCKDKCSCQNKKNKGEKPYKRKEKNLKFFKKRNFRKRPQGQRCYLCGRKGHFAKSCPNKADKAIKLVTSLKIRDEEVESLYSEQSSPDEDTVFALRNSSEEEYSEEETLPIFSTEEINSLNPSPPHPNIEVQILPTKFDKPVKAIAYIDTGAQKTMMNPDILPEELWSKKTSYFMAADGKIFKTELITKTFIGIKFFPDCIIWAKVIGNKLPGKDILIGMDVFSEADKLQIFPSGLKYKREFKSFVETSTLFSLSASPSEMEEIKKKLLSLCANNHGGFSHPRPLWKNPNFFVKLPFKLNEDVNPTKATHLGMTPLDLQLARQECQELLTQGLIEPTHSNWACQAFYVEKRSERVRGKKSLADQYGIMLAEKKIHLAQSEIDFLGMQFSKGFYQPQKHIAEELLKFPNHSLTTKQIQQFLGILNYIRDFIPKAAKYTSPLSKLLKKNPPPWGVEQTEAVQQIKKIAQNPPALKIPGDGNRILQTDASDGYWGAVLIEEIHDKKFYCGHASGQFKEAKDHYHTTYKEALAVKNGIKKFDFHLRDPQILRLKDWFSRYDFTVKHIKGNKNLIPDFLSRPPKVVQMITKTHSFPLIFMVRPLPNCAKIQKLYPPGLSPRTPKDILDYAKSRYFFFLHETLKFKVIHPSAFDPTNPNGNIFYLFYDIGWDLCEPTLWAIWCKTVQHSTPIALQTKKAYQILTDPLKHDFLFWTVLEWFSPITWWRSELEHILSYQENQRKTNAQALVSIFIVYRPYAINPSGQLFSQNHAHTWGTFEEYPLNDRYKRQLKGHLQETNLSSHSPSNRLIPSSSRSRQITVCSEYHIPAQLFRRTEDLVSPEESPDDLMNEDSDDPKLSPSHEPICKEVAYFGVSMLCTCLFEGILCIRTLRIYGIFQNKYALHLPLQGDHVHQKTPNMVLEYHIVFHKKEQCNILVDLDFQVLLVS
ncbi:hypothetical protein V8G54_034190 [Vigna mungo]|uniref:CCHC-type domain-containing protein n=1 Tax=Vigna mungo TaxID=3915 RepID=A0AAQ3MPS0_VIGMU